MNVKMIRYIISKMMGAEGLLMLLAMMVGIIYGEHTSVYFLITAAILTAIYLLLDLQKTFLLYKLEELQQIF